MSFDLRRELLLRTKDESFPNNNIIMKVLRELVQYYISTKVSQQKINSINKAIASISNLRYNIISGKSPKIPSVGVGISARIDEIIATGTLTELGHDESYLEIQELCTVSGIGPVKAKQLIEMGIHNVAMLKDAYLSGTIKIAKNELTHHIAVGLKYYTDIKERIPWDEVAEFKKIVNSYMPPDYHFTICGSFRRKMLTCGDIDVLLTHNRYKIDEDDHAHYLSDIINILSNAGIIVDNLTSGGDTKYMGIIKINADGLGRRLDIRLISKESKPFALLYFTGSGEFNKIMRSRALDLGYTLNEYNIIKLETGEKLHLSSEKEIFSLLDCAYVKPHDR